MDDYTPPLPEKRTDLSQNVEKRQTSFFLLFPVHPEPVEYTVLSSDEVSITNTAEAVRKKEMRAANEGAASLKGFMGNFRPSLLRGGEGNLVSGLQMR